MEKSLPQAFAAQYNPIPELIDNCTFGRLKTYGLLDVTALRNYCIKRLYFRYRHMGLSMFDSLQKLSGEYGLSYEYLRKMTGVSIIYVRKERKIVK